MSKLTMQIRSGASVRLVNSPIPDDQILEGEPRARMWISAQSPDLKVTQGVWECSAGKFTWHYTWDEFVFVLEGEAAVVEEGGESRTFKAGDYVHFPAGLSATWHVPDYVRKTFVLRTPEPLELYA